MIRTALLTVSLLLAADFTAAQQPEDVDSTTAPPAQKTLAELFQSADLAAVVRVEQTDYEKTRSFPSSGWALLQVLIPYKGTERGEIIEVVEQGLALDACYYPELAPLQFEGDRYLIFVNKDPTRPVFRGRAPACKIPVAVTDTAEYAVIAPIDGIALPAEAVQTVRYSDPAAFVDATEFSRARRQALETRYHATLVEADPPIPGQYRYVYTKGLPISTLRPLLKQTSSDE